MLRSRRLAAVAGAVILAATLAGCSTTVHLEPADDANNPGCAEVSVRLPDTVAELDRVWTDAQATGAWGDPTVVLRCGVEPPGPSDLPCYKLGGVDWLALGPEEEVQRAVTFGRDPAVEMVVSRESGIDFATVLEEIGRKVAAAIPDQSAVCTDTVPLTPADE